MKTKIEIDLKSLTLGVIATAVVVLGVAATNGSSTASVGRFQLVISNDGKAAMVDSATGQCWTAVINSNGQAVGTIGTVSFLTPKNP